MNFIKRSFLIIASAVMLCSLAATLPVVLSGCTTSQQTVAGKSLYTLEHTTTSAYDAYAIGVIKGTIPTNSLPQVSAKFNQFQAGMTLAITLAQNNTNAIAPANLIVESQELLSLINSITKK
jgi:hypothetical protein